MRRAITALLLSMAAVVTAVCSGASTPAEPTTEITRSGARCQGLEFEPDNTGRVSVEGISFVIPDGFKAASCSVAAPMFGPLEKEWLWLHYGARHDEGTHTVVLAAGVWSIDPLIATRITPEQRAAALLELANGEFARSGEEPNFREFAAEWTDVSVSGLDCVGYHTDMLDLGARLAEPGEGWPMQLRGVWCLDSANPPTRVAHLFWSERHPPSVAGMSAAEADEQSRSFLTSLEFLLAD